MDRMVIAKSETLDGLSTSIRSNLRGNDHVSNVSKEAAMCLGLLKRCKKYFTPSDLRTIRINTSAQVFARNTRLSGRSHAFTAATMSAQHITEKIHTLPVLPDRGTIIIFFFFIILARTSKIGEGLGRILSCGGRKPEQT